VGRPPLNAREPAATARALVAGGKGLLAMDESNPACGKRFGRAGISQTGEARRACRALIVTTAGPGECSAARSPRRTRQTRWPAPRPLASREPFP